MPGSTSTPRLTTHTRVQRHELELARSVVDTLRFADGTRQRDSAAVRQQQEQQQRMLDRARLAQQDGRRPPLAEQRPRKGLRASWLHRCRCSVRALLPEARSARLAWDTVVGVTALAQAVEAPLFVAFVRAPALPRWAALQWALWSVFVADLVLLLLPRGETATASFGARMHALARSISFWLAVLAWCAGARVSLACMRRWRASVADTHLRLSAPTAAIAAPDLAPVQATRAQTRAVLLARLPHAAALLRIPRLRAAMLVRTPPLHQRTAHATAAA